MDTTLANELDGVFKTSLFLLIVSSMFLVLMMLESTASLRKLRDMEDKVMFIVSVLLVFATPVSLLISRATLNGELHSVDGSDKKYFSSQIKEDSSDGGNYSYITSKEPNSLSKKTSFNHEDFAFKDGCYVSNKENLKPGDAVLLQVKGTQVWAELLNDEQTLQEVEYVVKGDNIFHPYNKRMVDLLHFSLGDFEKCELKPDLEEKSRLKQQQEFDRLNG